MDEGKNFNTEELCALRAGISVICGAKREIDRRRVQKEAFELYDSEGDSVEQEETDPDVYRYYRHICEVDSKIQYYNNLPKTIVALPGDMGNYPYKRQNYNYRTSSDSRNKTLEIMKKILAIMLCCIALLFLAAFVYAIVSPQATDTFGVTMVGIGGFVVCAAMLTPLVSTRRRSGKAAKTCEYDRRVEFTKYNVVYEPAVMQKKAEYVALQQKIDEDREFVEKYLEENAKEEGKKARLVYRAFARIFAAKGIDESRWQDIDSMIVRAERGEEAEQGEEVSFADVYVTMGTVMTVCIYDAMNSVYGEYVKICESECGGENEGVCFGLDKFSKALGAEKDLSSEELVAILEEIKKADFAF